MVLDWAELRSDGIIIPWSEVKPELCFLSLLLPMNELIGYDNEEKCVETPGSSSIQSNLERQKRILEDRLAKVNAGLAVLANDPKLADALETITKAMRA